MIVLQMPPDPNGVYRVYTISFDKDGKPYRVHSAVHRPWRDAVTIHTSYGRFKGNAAQAVAFANNPDLAKQLGVIVNP